MIYLAVVCLAITALAAFLVYENRKLTYAVMARHTGDLANLEKAQRRQPKPSAETGNETTYHTWRNPDEGVGP